jgi:hypothetical protein
MAGRKVDRTTLAEIRCGDEVSVFVINGDSARGDRVPVGVDHFDSARLVGGAVAVIDSRAAAAKPAAGVTT